MLSARLRQSIFPHSQLPTPTAEQVSLSVEHLKQQRIYGRQTELPPMVDFDPPPLVGHTIEDHFHNIGQLVAEPYLSLAQQFIKHSRRFPKMPLSTRWELQPGWTKYLIKDGTTQSVPVPDADDQVLVFDVEVLVPDSPYPVMAIALSQNAWYGWVSPYLAGSSSHPRHLIPLSSSKPRLVIGHNVGYDRARILEERHLQRSQLAFLDTMSLHVAVSGLCSRQRPTWLRYSRAVKENDEEYLRINQDTGRFFEVSSLNSLREVAWHYCRIQMDKSQRDLFVEGTLEEVRREFQQQMSYCARDVDATRRVYGKLLPLFLSKCPHPATFAGMLTMLEAYLPVDQEWTAYIERSEKLLEELTESVTSKLRELAEQALEVDNPMGDPWLRNLDWAREPQKFTKPRYLSDGKTYAKNGSPRPYANQQLPGYPKWYRDLWDRKQQRVQVTVRSRIAPYLLKLKWDGYPLHHSPAHGWMFRVPQSDSHLDKFKRMRAVSNDAGDLHFKIPHPDGESANCGNPMAKSYQKSIEGGILSSTYPVARQAIEMNAKCSYWISARERIKSQFVVWHGHGMGKGVGVILPCVIPMGTATRRAVEATWMTASNAKKNRLGSELKSMVRCPPGYKFVGADVDSEELWISALMGDAQFRMHGATAFGWMTLQGTKAEGTDLHSSTARILGIDRGSAKIFNYGRIYGAGVKYATSLLMQFNPSMTSEEALERAQKLYASTKGTSQKKRQQKGSFWHGGTESYMFNQLEAVATSDDPRTPALGCGVTDALIKRVAGTRFMTSRVNWAVQSSGVDYLHCLLVSVSYLSRLYRVDMRFVISVHDEVRYLVSDKDVGRAELALQVANLWVRALFSWRLGIEDLPQSVAFFSAVDVDHTLRKEVDMECVTPTNPRPIAPGVSHTIEETLEATQGQQLEVSRGSEYRLINPRTFLDPIQIKASHRPAPLPHKSPDIAWLRAQMAGPKPRKTTGYSTVTRILR